MSFVYHGAIFLEKKPKVDGGECARLVQNLLPWIGHTSMWRPGENVIDVLASGRQIAQGTAIATFVNGRYPTSGSRHAALFLMPMMTCTYDPKTGRCKLWAIKVIDQWVDHLGKKKRDIDTREINIYGKNAAYPISNNASMFYIIE